MLNMKEIIVDVIIADPQHRKDVFDLHIFTVEAINAQFSVSTQCQSYLIVIYGHYMP